MKNYEIVKMLRAQYEDACEALHAQHIRHIEQYEHKFTKEELMASGWVYDSYYPAGMEDLYKKNGKMVRFSESGGYVLSYSTPTYQFLHMEELNDWAK